MGWTLNEFRDKSFFLSTLCSTMKIIPWISRANPLAMLRSSFYLLPSDIFQRSAQVSYLKSLGRLFFIKCVTFSQRTMNHVVDYFQCRCELKRGTSLGHASSGCEYAFCENPKLKIGQTCNFLCPFDSVYTFHAVNRFDKEACHTTRCWRSNRCGDFSLFGFTRAPPPF